MQSVNCYFCGSADAEILDVQDFHDEYLEYIDPAYLEAPRYWKVCRDCGGVYHSPRLDKRDVDRLYRKRYRRHSLKNETTPEEFFDRIVALPKAESENWAKVEYLKAKLDSLPLPQPETPAILDIGCSAGMFLKLFLDEFPDWLGHGIEPTESFAELGSRKLGIEIKGRQYSPGLFDRKFDLVTVIHVVEHLLDPLTFFHDLRTDVADGGYLYIEVPDLVDFRNLPPQHDRFMSPHVLYYSPESLGDLLRSAGWSVISQETMLSPRGHGNLVTLCRRDREPGPLRLSKVDPGRILGLREAYDAANPPSGT